MLDLSQSETSVLDSIPYAFPISQLIAGETQHDWKCVTKEGNLAILDASLRIRLVVQISVPGPSMCEWRGHMIVGRLDFSQGRTLGSFSSGTSDVPPAPSLVLTSSIFTTSSSAKKSTIPLFLGQRSNSHWLPTAPDAFRLWVSHLILVHHTGRACYSHLVDAEIRA